MYSHLCNPEESLTSSNVSDIRANNFEVAPDRVAIQDASAQMALLQFMTCGMSSTAVPASIHCDHLIVGKDGAEEDLVKSIATNKEVLISCKVVVKNTVFNFGDQDLVSFIKLF